MEDDGEGDLDAASQRESDELIVEETELVKTVRAERSRAKQGQTQHLTLRSSVVLPNCQVSKLV